MYRSRFLHPCYVLSSAQAHVSALHVNTAGPSDWKDLTGV